MRRRTEERERLKTACENFIRTGHLGSMEVIYLNYFDLLYNYGRRFNCENELIEDAIQNTFVNLIGARERLKNVRNLPSYIFHSFRHELFRLVSESRKITATDIDAIFIDEPQSSREEQIISEESDVSRKDWLARCIESLPPSQQEIIHLRFTSGLSYEQISETVEISVESCRTAVYRALKAIRDNIPKNKPNRRKK